MKNKIVFLTLLLSTAGSFSQKQVSYDDAGKKLNGLAYSPTNPSKNKPGVLILPAWKGIDNNAKEAAARLQKDGYIVFIADIYGKGNYPKNNKEAAQQAGFYKENYKAYQHRIELALTQLLQQGANQENIVAIGYCFGGTGVLEAARANMKLKGVVSFHGGLGKSEDRPNGAITTKVLILHGADDFYESKEEIEAVQKELKDANADWQMIYYANAVHAFTDKEAGNDPSKGAAYNALADKRSWQHFNIFLDETLSK